MSTHKVEVSTIDEVLPHPNADRLELVRVKGWICVTGKGNFKAGDTCIYIPIDSVLSEWVEKLLFPPDSKITLNNRRVKTIKIRGHISQGMAVQPTSIFDSAYLSRLKLGDDLAQLLEITKYEPPKKLSANSNAQPRKKREENPHFKKYTDLENIKHYPTAFSSADQVVVTEKIHGTNFRAGWVPFVARTWWHKIRGWFGKNPTHEFVYGSRNLQLQERAGRRKNTYYDTNVYEEAVIKYDLKNNLDKGVIVYGEIYGPSIQPGYHYNLKDQERALVIFDVYVIPESTETAGYASHWVARAYCDTLDLPYAPVLYTGDFANANVEKLASGPSILAPSQTVIEGVVVKTITEIALERRILKVINPDYLLSKHADDEVAHDQA